MFCDLSSPKGGRSFSVYDDLRARLIDAGIPGHEIAFIHDADTDAKKAKLFKSVREGKVRVQLGSTQKMGIGTNVQDRLVAQHDLDAPWRPCDVEQRDGRILRQGNLNDEVDIFRYVTEGSFDSYLWQTLETKARFIAQVMRGDRALRSVEDVALATLSYSEVKALASGNPLVIEKAGVDAELVKLSSLHWVWRSQRYANEQEVASLPATIEAVEKTAAAHEADLARLQPQERGAVTVHIGGRRITGSEAVGEVLRAEVLAARTEVSALRGHQIRRMIGQFGGFDLGIFGSSVDSVPTLYLQGQALYQCSPYQMAPMLIGELLATLASVTELCAKSKTRLQAYRKRLVDLQAELARPFEHELRLNALRARQSELLALLDLTKDEAGSQQAESTEELVTS